MVIKQLKLMNGDEIVCTIQEEAEDSLLISDALVVRETQLEMQEFEGHEVRGYRLCPWMTYQVDVSGILELSKSNILVSCIPGDHIVQHYAFCLDCLSDLALYDYSAQENLQKLISTTNNLDSDSNVVKFPDQ